MIELENKKILLLGASGFIGTRTAILLSKLGAKLILSGRNESNLKKILPQLQGHGHQVIPFDLKKIDEISDFVKLSVSIDGNKLSGLVFCNAISTIRPLKSITYEFINDMMLTNYYSFIEFIKCFSDKRISLKGESSIVALSSYASNNGDKGQLIYSATKAAIDSSVNVLSKELKSKGIRINSIRPAALLPEEINFEELPISIQKLIENMQTGPISPESIAEQIAFLLSSSSSGITGKCFDVKGCLQ